MTWRPSSSSSVSKAHFITTRAISMVWGYLWAIHPELFLFSRFGPILWPTDGHLENQTLPFKGRHLCQNYFFSVLVRKTIIDGSSTWEIGINTENWCSSKTGHQVTVFVLFIGTPLSRKPLKILNWNKLQIEDNMSNYVWKHFEAKITIINICL
jgi:hypothetical protein